jgi:hypothetical protein
MKKELHLLGMVATGNYFLIIEVVSIEVGLDPAIACSTI